MHNKTERLVSEKIHEQMISEWMADPVFKMEYALENEYQELREMLQSK